MKLSLRNRLLAVALLGVFTCTVALYGLARILQVTVAVRFARAREAVGTELAVMRRDAPLPSTDRPATLAHVSMLGMRGGYVAPGAEVDLPPPDFDDATRAGVNAVVQLAARERDTVLRDAEGTDP